MIPTWLYRQVLAMFSLNRHYNDTLEQLKKCLAAGFKLNTSNCQSLKEVGWAMQPIYMGRSNAAIRRWWQEWVDTGRFQRLDGSGRPRATTDQEDRLICLVLNPASICVPTIIEDVSRDGQGSVQILLLLFHARHTLNREL
ncbi:hypothetical protein TNCV_2703151 [Trichonephila clavipes]|nr:hypothetical protein TNCV_2703151 [Trichonephila clavipes]